MNKESYSVARNDPKQNFDLLIWIESESSISLEVLIGYSEIPNLEQLLYEHHVTLPASSFEIGKISAAVCETEVQSLK